ncbi:MAG: glycosyltransferase family 2 protein [Lachnospiraceae bacterium]|nr:glycosyltransferase family 2 protein [Lachnospiraceae bacterium]
MISVIVPVYNVEKYLEKCVKSIIAQSYQNIEIILIDDGSTDTSGCICEKLALEDSRIMVVHQKNEGLSAARNKGLLLASGEYISFVDSDDAVSKYFLEHLLMAIQGSDAAVSMCDFQETIGEEGKEYSTVEAENPKKNVNYTQCELFEIISDVCHSENSKIVVAWNKLYRREIFQTLRYPQGKIHEDEFVIHQVIAQIDKLVYVPEKLYFYTRRQGSITAGKKNYDAKHLNVIEAYEKRTVYYKKNLSRDLYSRMTIALFEMITIQYRDLMKSGNADENEVKHLLKRQMKEALGMHGQAVGMRKKMKYWLFILFPNVYYKKFWKDFF